MDPRRARSDDSRNRPLWTLIALLPAAGFGLHAVRNANFALIDDGMTLRIAQGALLPMLKPDSRGRFMPLYWLYYWVLVRIGPVEPWLFALGNALVLTLAAWLAFRTARRLSGPFAGLVAAWLTACNLPFIENLYTYGKQEPRHALFWLLLILVLIRLLERPVTAARAVLAGLGAGLLCALSKETGVLAVIPAGVVLLAWWRDRKRPEGPPAGAAFAALCAALPAAALAVPLLLMTRRAGSYAQTNLMTGRAGLLNLHGVFGVDAALTALWLAALATAGWLILTRTGRGKTGHLILASAFVALLGFFTLLPNTQTYYLLPPAALAAVLAGCGAGELFNSGGRRLALVGTPILLAAGLVSATLYAGAFSGWSWLYAQLGESVAAGQPGRVLFRQAGSYEIHFEADLTWRQLRGLPVSVGVLDCQAPEPGVTCVAERDVNAGDWIVEQFGDAQCNPLIPVRDFGVARSVDDALIGGSRSGSFPAVEVVRHRARFLCPVNRLLGRSTFIEWRIYRVTSAPRIAWDGLSDDGWMGERATLRLRPAGARELRLPSWAFLPAGRQNRLFIREGDRLLATCPGGAASADCRVPLEGLAAVDAAGWVELKLTSESVYVPREFGLNDDSRRLSFNLLQARTAGSGILDDGPR